MSNTSTSNKSSDSLGKNTDDESFNTPKPLLKNIKLTRSSNHSSPIIPIMKMTDPHLRQSMTSYSYTPNKTHAIKNTVKTTQTSQKRSTSSSNSSFRSSTDSVKRSKTDSIQISNEDGGTSQSKVNDKSLWDMLRSNILLRRRTPITPAAPLQKVQPKEVGENVPHEILVIPDEDTLSNENKLRTSNRKKTKDIGTNISKYQTLGDKTKPINVSAIPLSNLRLQSKSFQGTEKSSGNAHTPENKIHSISLQNIRISSIRQTSSTHKYPLHNSSEIKKTGVPVTSTQTPTPTKKLNNTPDNLHVTVVPLSPRFLLSNSKRNRTPKSQSRTEATVSQESSGKKSQSVQDIPLSRVALLTSKAPRSPNGIPLVSPEHRQTFAKKLPGKYAAEPLPNPPDKLNTPTKTKNDTVIETNVQEISLLDVSHISDVSQSKIIPPQQLWPSIDSANSKDIDTEKSKDLVQKDSNLSDSDKAASKETHTVQQSTETISSNEKELEPMETEPVEPEIAEPGLGEPNLEEPDLEEFHVEDSARNLALEKPAVNEPEINVLELEKHAITDPKINQPELRGSGMKKPELGNPEVIDIEVNEPDSEEPEVQDIDINDSDSEVDIKNKNPLSNGLTHVQKIDTEEQLIDSKQVKKIQDSKKNLAHDIDGETTDNTRNILGRKAITNDKANFIEKKIADDSHANKIEKDSSNFNRQAYTKEAATINNQDKSPEEKFILQTEIDDIGEKTQNGGQANTTAKKNSASFIPMETSSLIVANLLKSHVPTNSGTIGKGSQHIGAPNELPERQRPNSTLISTDDVSKPLGKESINMSGGLGMEKKSHMTKDQEVDLSSKSPNEKSKHKVVKKDVLNLVQTLSSSSQISLASSENTEYSKIREDTTGSNLKESPLEASANMVSNTANITTTPKANTVKGRSHAISKNSGPMEKKTITKRKHTGTVRSPDTSPRKKLKNSPEALKTQSAFSDNLSSSQSQNLLDIPSVKEIPLGNTFPESNMKDESSKESRKSLLGDTPVTTENYASLSVSDIHKSSKTGTKPDAGQFKAINNLKDNYKVTATKYNSEQYDNTFSSLKSSVIEAPPQMKMETPDYPILPQITNSTKMEIIYISDSESDDDAVSSKNEKADAESSDIELFEEKIASPETEAVEEDTEAADTSIDVDPDKELKKFKHHFTRFAYNKLKNKTLLDKQLISELIYSGIAKHTPLNASTLVSVSNDICSSSNFQHSYTIFYQQIHKKDRITYTPITPNLEAVLDPNTYLLNPRVPELKIADNEISKSQTKPTQNISQELSHVEGADQLKALPEGLPSGKPTERQESVAVKSIKSMEHEPSHPKSDTTTSSLVKGFTTDTKPTTQDMEEFNSLASQRTDVKTPEVDQNEIPEQNIISSTQKKPSREAWKKDWLSNLQGSAVYFKYRNCGKEGEQKHKDEYKKIYYIFTEVFKCSPRGSLDPNVDIIILGENDDEAKLADDAILGKYRSDMARLSPGKKVRIWSLNKTLKFIKDIGIDITSISTQSLEGSDINYEMLSDKAYEDAKKPAIGETADQVQKDETILTHGSNREEVSPSVKSTHSNKILINHVKETISDENENTPQFSGTTASGSPALSTQQSKERVDLEETRDSISVSSTAIKSSISASNTKEIKKEQDGDNNTNNLAARNIRKQEKEVGKEQENENDTNKLTASRNREYNKNTTSAQAINEVEGEMSPENYDRSTTTESATNIEPEKDDDEEEIVREKTNEVRDKAETEYDKEDRSKNEEEEQGQVIVKQVEENVPILSVHVQKAEQKKVTLATAMKTDKQAAEKANLTGFISSWEFGSKFLPKEEPKTEHLLDSTADSSVDNTMYNIMHSLDTAADIIDQKSEALENANKTIALLCSQILQQQFQISALQATVEEQKNCIKGDRDERRQINKQLIQTLIENQALELQVSRNKG